MIVLPLSAEGGVDFSGEIQTIWGASVSGTDNNTSAGRFLLGETSFTGTLDAYYDKSSAFAEAAVSYDATSNQLDWRVNELWLDYTASFWGIRIGRQKTAWGKADGIDITNVICPKDMSSFSSMTSDNSKLAIDALRLSFTGNQFTLDAYWIPFFTPSKLPLDEGNQLRKFIIPENSPYPMSLGTIEKPEIDIWNGEYGLKVSGYFPLMDVSLYGFYGWDDTPVLDYNITAQGIQINGKYKRLSMIGIDMAIPVKEIVIRTEAAFFPQKYFSVIEQRNEISALAGVDWMPSSWTLTAQYFCDYVFGSLVQLERSKAYTHGMTINVSKTFINETLELSLSGLLNFNDLDSFISPAAEYSLSDQIKLSCGAYIFIPGSENDGEYGKYKDLSSAYIKAKFNF
ncbi:hypothetical protein SAMN04487775_111107 [Treponema bryantii]|uniref:Uncharacterized protein n=2 Tax=Treponema bryantii TaxID=163 RepID=A0A1I3N2B1_9SPIR|nr:hypothetical protein SAMN04487775_111107 [Treponema bryantii]